MLAPVSKDAGHVPASVLPFQLAAAPEEEFPSMLSKGSHPDTGKFTPRLPLERPPGAAEMAQQLNAPCSWRGPKCSSQHLQLSVIPDPEAPVPRSGP